MVTVSCQGWGCGTPSKWPWKWLTDRGDPTCSPSTGSPSSKVPSLEPTGRPLQSSLLLGAGLKQPWVSHSPQNHLHPEKHGKWFFLDLNHPNLNFFLVLGERSMWIFQRFCFLGFRESTPNPTADVTTHQASTFKEISKSTKHTTLRLHKRTFGSPLFKPQFNIEDQLGLFFSDRKYDDEVTEGLYGTLNTQLLYIFSLSVLNISHDQCTYECCHLAGNPKSTTPPKLYLDTKNDVPWTMYLRIQAWRHWGYLFVAISRG